MGMQCTFSEHDLLDQNCELDKTHHEDSDTWSVVISDKASAGMITAHYIPAAKPEDTGFCWFDVGSRTQEQLLKLGWLITRRICFTCA